MLLSLTLLFACDGGDSQVVNPVDTVPEDTAADLDGPIIDVDPVPSPQLVGEDITLTARVVDVDSDVFVVQLLYRKQTSENFKQTGMVLTDPEKNIYSGKISADDLGSGGMHYYFSAVDTSQNTSTLPLAAPDEYYKFDLTDVE